MVITSVGKMVEQHRLFRGKNSIGYSSGECMREFRETQTLMQKKIHSKVVECLASSGPSLRIFCRSRLSFAGPTQKKVRDE